MSRNVQQTGPQTGRHRLDILRTFFHQTVDVMQEDLEKSAFFKENIKNTEQFWIAEYHKCHALISDENILCVLFVSAVPTMRWVLRELTICFKYFIFYLIFRFITQKTLNTLLSEKDFVWQI
jgi:hypothetical protein